MSFVYPSVLWALSLLTIPILIHLFNFRRYRKLLFTNVHFLKEVLQETRSRKNVKHWVILLSRLLMLAALILAFAQPIIPSSPNLSAEKNKSIVIYLDNSFSMGASGENGPLLDVGREKARQIARALAKDHRLYFMSNDLPPYRPLDLSSIEERLDRTEFTGRHRPLSELRSVIQATLAGEQATAYLITDLQKSNFDLEEPLSSEDSLIDWQFVPVKPNVPTNISVDTLWFTEPVLRIGASLSARIGISNHSDDELNDVSVKLVINEKTATVTAIDLAANEQHELDLGFSINDTGWIKGRVELSDHPVTFDDQLYFSFYSAPGSKILILEEEDAPQFIQRVYNTDSFYRTVVEDPLEMEYSSLSQYQLIILNGLVELTSGLASSLESYVSQGGKLAIFPASEGVTDIGELSKLTRLRSYKDLAKTETKADQINEQHPLFEGVFENLPKNLNAPNITKILTPAEPVRVSETSPLRTRDGYEVFTTIPHKKGRIFQSFIALDDAWGNMHRHALFVPLMLKLGLSEDQQLPLYIQNATNTAVSLVSETPLQQGDVVISLDQKEWIPELRQTEGLGKIYIGTELSEPGIYSVQTTNNTLIQTLALNHDRKESDPAIMPIDELMNQIGIEESQVINESSELIGERIRTLKDGKQLWPWFVSFALLFLLIEIILLRLWKTSV
jgi:hypothetical protein